MKKSKQSGKREIYFEVYIKARPSIVWSAITDPSKICVWDYMDKVTVDVLKPGGSFLFYCGKDSKPDKGEILKVSENKKLVYRWYSVEPEPTIIEYTLKQQGKFTRLIFRNYGFGSGGKWENYYEKDYVGWAEMHLDLKRFVENRLSKGYFNRFKKPSAWKS